MQIRHTVLGVAVAGILGLATAPAMANLLYFDFNQNYEPSNANASVFLFGQAGQAATVSNLAGFSENVTLGVDGFYNLSIPNGYQQAGTGIRTSGFKVSSSKAIAGYFINREPFSTDMTYLLGDHALGKHYVIANYENLAGAGDGSQVAIHATEDNTTVTFTPHGGSPIHVTLNAGETYKYSNGSADLTGSFVSASAPVAVFAGDSCANVPSHVPYCDTLLEQMTPTSELSRDYVVTATDGASLSALQADLVRVIATEDNTQVTVDGTTVATLAAGQHYEFNLAAGSGAHITASEPVAVAQYMTGGNGEDTDPAMSMVPGTNAWLDAYRLATPTGSQQFDNNFASVVIRTASLGSLKLNGTLVGGAGFSTIAGTLFSRGIVNLPYGIFSLTASDPFLTMITGTSNADSYFTYGGAAYSPGVSPDPTPPAGGNSVPEPGEWALLGACLALLFGTGRRLRNSSAV